MPPREITILHAPTPLGLKPPAPGRVPGVQHMPEALERAGLHRALGATLAGAVVPLPYGFSLDPELGVRNPYEVADYAVRLADGLAPLLDGAAFPVVLGGDCSLLIGVALALRRRGRYGLLHIDAHSDCQTPEVSETGGVAGMPLAIGTGQGPDVLTTLEGRRPYLRETDCVILGVRDLFDVGGAADDEHIDGTAIAVRSLSTVRRRGPARVAAEALDRLAAAGVDGVWVHVDADVLDPAVMPAVDSPDPGGLLPDELVALLAPLLQAPLVCGLDVTIYDPERDPDGAAAAVLVGVLTDAFAGAAEPPPVAA